jgi:hypothetical protein
LYFLFLLLPISGLFAQEEFSAFYEPELSVSFKQDTSKWSYNFALSNRNAVYENEDSQFHALFLDFQHFTNYEVGLYGKLSLGLKIRSLEIFDETAHDEIRLTGQYGYSRKYNNLKIAHRLRFENRFEDVTSYRTRYRFSVEFPLSGVKTNRNEFFLGLKTETLFSFGEFMVPELDQRIGADLGYQLFEDTEISLGLEYQYDDYLHDPEPELFVLTGVSISL